ncbi:hypothetical protein STANM309S_00188 [Streptomyces tanashiensis]
MWESCFSSARTVSEPPAPNTGLAEVDPGRRSVPTEPCGMMYARPLKSSRQGRVISAPGASVAWIIVMGVWVMPGPAWPSSSPAMTRRSAPPSGYVSSLDVAAADVLVARGHHLVLRREVHPQLEAVEEAAGHDEVLRRRLDVEQARAGRHPLGVAVGDGAATAVAVLWSKMPSMM